jgi:hypothetical protein
MNYTKAKQIMNENFIGYEELSLFTDKLNLYIDSKSIGTITNIPFDEDYLRSVSKTHLLILFTPLDKHKEFITLNKYRNFFGINPDKNEPCFYNQDWYINEPFANFSLKKEQWFCIRKELKPESRGKIYGEIDNLPLALICAYTFFAAYHIKSEYLWKNDFVWCKDTDSNGDRIYVGRYFDPASIAKNGFSVHRYLSINLNYGSI